MDKKEKIKNAISEEMLKLPRDSQQAISSVDWLSETEKVAGMNSLTEEETFNLQLETALMLVGLTDANYFIQNIENEISLSKEEAKKIGNEMLEKVFMPIAQKKEEIIKQNAKTRPQTWDKSMQFVLSGGDYSYMGDKPMAEAIREGIINPSVKLQIKSE